MKLPKIMVVTDEPPARKRMGEGRSSDAGKVSLLFGLISLPFAPLIFCGMIAVAFGIAGWIASSKSNGFPKRSRSAIAGIILGCLSFGLIALMKHGDSQMITKARKLTSLAAATALESAVNNFFTEYGALPSERNRVTTDTEDGVKFLSILLGLEDQSGKHQNTRDVKFLAIKEGKNRKGGLICDSSGKPESIFDPWGSPYTVELDVSYQEGLHFTIDSKTIDLKGRRVAVYSPGPDRKLGTTDDIKTW